MSRGSDPTPRRWRPARLLLALAALALGVAAVSCATSAPRYTGPVSDHFDGKRFFDEPAVHKGLAQVIKWQLSREDGAPWRRDMRLVAAPRPAERVHGPDYQVTFVNHATVLIQAGGLNVLTDPIWSERASPVSWAGPQRHRPPGVAFADLPPIDVVLLSHNHFDHMDIPTLERLGVEHRPLFVMPLGNCGYLNMTDDPRCVELDWWETRELQYGARVHAVPVRHWSRRGLLDTNQSLWAGFVLEAGGHRLFFAGDTGMGEHFARIRARLGPPDLAMLPIGAYLPRWFMAPQHIDPAEAVSAHEALGARRSMAIHFGTFRLADDGQHQPVAELRAALAERALAPGSFWIPDHGERMVAGGNRVAFSTAPAP